MPATTTAKKGRAMYVANTSGFAEVKGVERQFRQGITRISDDDPLLAACSDYFDLVEGQAFADIESATASPGEKRGA